MKFSPSPRRYKSSSSIDRLIVERNTLGNTLSNICTVLSSIILCQFQICLANVFILCSNKNFTGVNSDIPTKVLSDQSKHVYIMISSNNKKIDNSRDNISIYNDYTSGNPW